jgi:NADH-quinone oxidoreductase subunit M
MNSINLLSLLIFIPIVGFLVILTIQENYKKASLSSKYISLLTTIINFIIIVYISLNFSIVSKDYKFIEKISIYSAIDLNYYLGIDGISLIFLFLTIFLIFISILFSNVEERGKFYYSAILILQSAIIGMFCSLNILFFYIFFEVSIIPIFFLIGVFGGKDKSFVSFKFFLYTLFGSILILIAIIIMIFQSHTTSLDKLYLFAFSPNTQNLLWILMFVGFGIKSAIFPFHTWLPETYVNSPTSLNIILSGILVKLGIYGFIRFMIPMFPLASINYMYIVFILSLITVIYCGIIAYKQTNLNRFIAYYSISHMGLITASIFSFNAQGIEGALFQSISHGIFNCGLFLVVIFMENRLKISNLESSSFKGLSVNAPRLSIFFMIFLLASIGFPTTNGFIGEFLSLSGLFYVNRILTAFFTLTLLISCISILVLYRNLVFGSFFTVNTKPIFDLNIKETLTMLVLCFLIFFMGIYPDFFLDFLHTAVSNILDKFRSGLVIQEAILEIK